MERPTTVARLDAGPVEYRLEPRGDATVVVLHGGHVRAGLAVGEEVFAESGYTVLAPSRPGYGRTPLRTGVSAGGFADVTHELCRHLGIRRVAAVVGTSGGGPTAVALAARHPDLVERLILQSAVGLLPWPDRWTRVGAQVVFAAGTEQVTWGVLHTLLRVAPEVGLRWLLGGLSTLPARDVVAALSAGDRAWLLALLARMRSGRGFLNDLRATPEATAAAAVGQPTLVIASRNDGAVPLAHARSLVAAIRHAELVESRAESHFIWLGSDWPAIAETIRVFLTTDTTGPPRAPAPPVTPSSRPGAPP